MSKGARQSALVQPPTPQSNGAQAHARVAVPCGPKLCEVLSEVLSQHDVSRAAVLAFLEAKNLEGNYRLRIAAEMVPVEA